MRYQVLYDGKQEGENGGVTNWRTRREAEREKARLEHEGYRNVSVWDTQRNSLSERFRL